jgi:hypothetical protein
MRILYGADEGSARIDQHIRPHVDGENLEIEFAFTGGTVVMFEVDNQLVVMRHRSDESAQITFVNCSEFEIIGALRAFIATVAE